jgi:WD40 repeat protein
VNLKKHRVTSRVDGVIRSIAKRPGEYVHSGEKIMEIQSTEKVRLEGNVDAQYFDRLKRMKDENKDVTIEPAVPSAPIKSHSWHRSEVAAIAVTGHAKRPLVVSASMDGSALVWDPNLDNDATGALAPHSLPHPVGVRTVACTPPGVSPMLAITGAEDGKVRAWDVTDPAKLPKTPAREFEDAHNSGVRAIAVSPDGKFAATAAGRDVFVWDLASGKKKYTLPQEHRDSVTSLSFTPQAQLVTGSKDLSVKVWKLGDSKAAVTKTVDHRSGTVETLGVSPDGGRMLFDQDKSRIDLVTLTDAQTTGQITNGSPNISFGTLAIFGPDRAGKDTPADKLPPYTIATAGGEGDLKGGLQVWQAPRGGGRGAEIARLMTPNRVGVTCAAFSPSAERPFLVVGTERGSVHVWTPQTATQKQLEGRITNIESSDPRFITVRAELSNKGLGLLDRSSATIIVNPGK